MVFHRGIAVSIGPGLGQLAAGADRAGQHIHQSARTGLTAQAAVDQRLAVFEPRSLQRGACAEQDDHVGVDGSDRSQQIQLVLRQLHVHPVEALALLDLVQTHAEQDDIGVLRQRDGFLLQGFVGLALAVKALGIADIGQTALGQAVQEGIHLDGVDGTGTSTLIAGRLGKVTEDGDLLAFLQRQQRALVPEQNDALGSGAAGQRMMRGGVKGTGCLFDGSLGVEHQFQQLVQPGVHVVFRDLAALHGLHQLADGIVAGEWHLQRGAVLHAQCVVVGTAPVGDDRAVEAPVPAQDVL